MLPGAPRLPEALGARLAEHGGPAVTDGLPEWAEALLAPRHGLLWAIPLIAVALALYAQRYLVEGLSLGAVKG